MTFGKPARRLKESGREPDWSPMKLEKKVALITGAGSGIGKAIAIAFAKEGALCVLSGRNEEKLAQTKAEIAKLGRAEALVIRCDVTNASEVAETVKKTLDTQGRIDILVNNAGITRDQLIAMMSESDWDVVLSTNLKSVFLLTKSVAKPMVRQRSGCIINITSVIGIMGNAGQANYAASKAGIIAVTKSVARELGKRNITVNAIAPGFIETEMTSQLKEEARNALLNQIPLGRFGSPEEVASVAVFLASDEAKYITGQVIQVCGGMLT